MISLSPCRCRAFATVVLSSPSSTRSSISSFSSSTSIDKLGCHRRRFRIVIIDAW
jgi:hypothetical protein